MEAFNTETLQPQKKYKNNTVSHAHPSFRNPTKKFTHKSIMQFNGFSKSRIRRMKSISENITSLFKQNESKLHPYLKSNSVMSDTLTFINFESPQIFSTLTDGVYILIQGSVKMISFEEERPLPKASMKEIITNSFRKLRVNKQLTLKPKDCENDLGKKNSTNDKNQSFYTCGAFQEPFSVFQCVNENCCTFSYETILYKLDENEKKTFKYYENKQKLRQLFQQNKSLFKTNFMLFQTLLQKKFNFRNQFRVDNVALIKKGTLRVFSQEQSKNSESKSHHSKKLICELCESSLLVKGFTYEVSCCESEIIFVQNNETFQFIKNPEWVLRFQQRMAERMGKKGENRKKLEKKSTHTNFKKHMSKLSRHQSALNSFLSTHETNESQIPFIQSFNIEKELGKSLHPSSGHRKSVSELQKGSNPTQSPQIRQHPKQKQKKNDMLKMISPYILISQKTGLKEIAKTRSILNERSQNITPIKINSPLKLNKVSRNHLNKYQTQYSQPLLLQRYNLQNVPNDRRALLKFEKFLQQKNHKHYKEKIKANNKNLSKSHQKSSSQLAPITTSNFHLSFKKNKTMDMHIALQFDRINWSNQVPEIKKITSCL